MLNLLINALENKPTTKPKEPSKKPASLSKKNNRKRASTKQIKEPTSKAIESNFIIFPLIKT